MYHLILLFFNISILNKGPQDVPKSSWMLKLILPVYFSINLLLLLLNDYWSTALEQIAVDFFILYAFSWILLFFSGKTARFPQTLSALLGTDVVISCFRIPAIASSESMDTDLAFFIMLALMVWHWLAYGHIFRHALDKPLFFGLGLSFLYILIFFQVMSLLFPILASPT